MLQGKTCFSIGFFFDCPEVPPRGQELKRVVSRAGRDLEDDVCSNEAVDFINVLQREERTSYDVFCRGDDPLLHFPLCRCTACKPQ